MAPLTAVGAAMRVLPPRTYSATTRETQRLLPFGVAHPAKMAPSLVRDLFLRYTQPGQVVLDPFGGRGTSLLGCTLGRHVVLVELEPPFCGYARANWRHLRANSLPLPGVPLGWALVLRGDSRRLPLRSAADACISSPPYLDARSETTRGGGENIRYSPIDDPRNISSLPPGDVSSVLTSPPYADLASRHRATDANQQRAIARYGARYGHGDPARLVDGYGSSPGQIGNLPAAAITSPPYASTLSSMDENARTQVRANGKPQRLGASNFQDYGHTEGQIGAEEGETYSAAVLAVYREAFRVVRPGGVLVLVTGNFVRGGKVVDLAADTIALAQAAGWTPWERWEHRKSQVSFWRILHHSQGRPIVAHEDVLVFCKGERPGWDFTELEPTNRAPVTLERDTAGAALQQAALPLDLEEAG